MFKVILLPSVANPDPVGSEPFWSDPDPINCPVPVPVPDSIITSQKTRKKSKQLIIYMFFIYIL